MTSFHAIRKRLHFHNYGRQCIDFPSAQPLICLWSRVFLIYSWCGGKRLSFSIPYRLFLRLTHIDRHFFFLFIDHGFEKILEAKSRSEKQHFYFETSHEFDYYRRSSSGCCASQLVAHPIVWFVILRCWCSITTLNSPTITTLSQTVLFPVHEQTDMTQINKAPNPFNATKNFLRNVFMKSDEKENKLIIIFFFSPIEFSPIPSADNDAKRLRADDPNVDHHRRFQ